MNGYPDTMSLTVVLAMLGLVPVLVVLTTSFVKIVVVLSLVRNALGVQQVPPNLALHALALILTVYIMMPALTQMGEAVQTSLSASNETDEQAGQVAMLAKAFTAGVEPLRKFMLRHAAPAQRDFFLETAHHLWGSELAAGLQDDDLFILAPAFLVSELTHAFEVGFLLYLPFVVIDLIVSNILLALGMMMVSPVTLAMPLKLFLFVMVDGWTRLIHGLVLSYA